MLCAKLNWPVGLEKRMWKVQDNKNNDNDDDKGQRKNVSQNNAYKPSAQVSWTLDRGRNSTYLEGLSHIHTGQLHLLLLMWRIIPDSDDSILFICLKGFRESDLDSLFNAISIPYKVVDFFSIPLVLRWVADDCLQLASKFTACRKQHVQK